MRPSLTIGLLLAGMAAPACAETLRDAFIQTYTTSPTLTAARARLRGTDEGVPIAKSGGRLQAHDSLPPLIFTVPTRLTQPTPMLAEVAAACLPATRAGTIELLRLAAHIRAAVAYQVGATHVASTAAEAMVLGAGVCQDHAHIFLACCHARGVPARYVSGYIDPGSTGHAASHAWVDAWAEDDDFTGWVSIDVTHGRLMDEGYCRLAIGRDYESAAPVRGMRRGGGDETMRIEAQIVPVQ